MTHYAEAFSTQYPGECFRYVFDHSGRPTHCPNPPTVRGRFKDANGRRHRVESCDEHAEDVEQKRPIPEKTV
jgi:hypothetical protein